jgi:hypothetical protein
MKKGFVVTAIIALMVSVTPLSAQQIEYVGSTLWSGVSDIRVRGDYAYCSCVNGVMIFNISHDSTINFVSKLYLGGKGNGIEISGNYAYIADGICGLRILNISNPDNPILLGTCATGGSAVDICISGIYAYIADAVNGLIIIDISNPINPQILGIVNYNYYASKIVKVRNNIAYLNTSHRNTSGTILRFVDVADPLNPITIGEYNPGYFGEISDIAVEGNYAFLVEGYDRLRILNISNPANPITIGSCQAYCGRDIFLSESYAYIGCTNNTGLRIVDISDPVNPMPIVRYSTGGDARYVFVTGNYAFLLSGLDYNSSLKNINISNPLNPSLKSQYKLPSSINNMYISDTLAYLASATGLMVINIADPSNLSVLADYYTGMTFESDICVSGNYAYLTGFSNGFRVLFVGDPANPQNIGGNNGVGGSGRIFIRGNSAYLANSIAIQIIDITCPYNPVLLGSVATPNNSKDIFADSIFSYVATYDYGLEIIKTTNPVYPQFVGGCPTPGNATGIFVQEDYAYIAADFAGLQIINISNPLEPILAGNFDTPGRALDVFVMGEYAYVADYYSVEIINIADPTNPTFVTNFATPGKAKAIFTQGNYLYVSNYYSFMILSFSTNGVEEQYKYPSSFSLSPNYPNPFNSSTTIRYNLPTESPVTIDIYDILGRKVQTLLDVKAQAGTHQVNWNADGLPSGAYFARLKAGQHSQTMKMILMK